MLLGGSVAGWAVKGLQREAKLHWSGGIKGSLGTRQFEVNQEQSRLGLDEWC